MQLSTRRFLLRDFTGEDRPAFAAYHADPRFMEFYDPEENSAEHASELVNRFRAWAEETPRLNYQLAITEGETLIGCCGLRMKDARPGTAEFGIELAPAYWGRFGYALEPMQCLVAFGFRELELEQITGVTVSANTRISRLAKAFGARATEIQTPDWMASEGWHQIAWRIDREQWLARPDSRWF